MSNNLKKIFGDNHGLDNKSVDFLVGALEKNNLPGFDYIEFKQSLAALSAMSMDEATAFKSAFATASTVGLTKDKLIETANHYKKVLLNERSQFDNALQKQKHQKVDGKMKEVEKLKAQIDQYKQKIAQLEEQIGKNQKVIDNADAQMNESKAKIEETQQNFEHTHQSIINQINKDVDNINTYL